MGGAGGCSERSTAGSMDETARERAGAVLLLSMRAKAALTTEMPRERPHLTLSLRMAFLLKF